MSIQEREQMITRENLKFVSTASYHQGHQRDVVEFEGNHYIVGSVNTPVDTSDEEALFEYLQNLGPDGFMMLLGLVPLNETFVMEAKWDEQMMEFVPKNECGPQCETGVCNKRVATNTQVGNQDLAYSMLIAHLNA